VCVREREGEGERERERERERGRERERERERETEGQLAPTVDYESSNPAHLSHKNAGGMGHRRDQQHA